MSYSDYLKYLLTAMDDTESSRPSAFSILKSRLEKMYRYPIGICADKSSITIRDAVPGIKNTEVDASYSDGVIKISAVTTPVDAATIDIYSDRFTAIDDSENKYEYNLCISLSGIIDEFDMSKVSVSVYEGMLKVVLPYKVEKVTSKKIKVTGPLD